MSVRISYRDEFYKKMAHLYYKKRCLCANFALWKGTHTMKAISTPLWIIDRE